MTLNRLNPVIYYTMWNGRWYAMIHVPQNMSVPPHHWRTYSEEKHLMTVRCFCVVVTFLVICTKVLRYGLILRVPYLSLITPYISRLYVTNAGGHLCISATNTDLLVHIQRISEIKGRMYYGYPNENSPNFNFRILDGFSMYRSYLWVANIRIVDLGGYPTMLNKLSIDSY